MINFLVLTDHRAHQAQNSLYELVRALQDQNPNARIEIASRGNSENEPFFYGHQEDEIHVQALTQDFHFDPNHRFFSKSKVLRKLSDYHWILLRLPRPVEASFFDFLTNNFDERKIINRPSGIEKTSNKLYLLNYQKWCPPMKHCQSMDDIKAFASQFPIVLKPLKNYGGKGLIRIDGNEVWLENKASNWSELEESLQDEEAINYLAMKFLNGVHLGDKRIMVSNEKILGATLRLPSKGSWLCNVSQGGSSIGVELEEREMEMVHSIIPDLRKEGVILFGIDTLASEDGVRYLSEINTLSLGGLAPADQFSQQPIIQRAAEGIWQYIAQIEKGKPNPH